MTNFPFLIKQIQDLATELDKIKRRLATSREELDEARRNYDDWQKTYLRAMSEFSAIELELMEEVEGHDMPSRTTASQTLAQFNLTPEAIPPELSDLFHYLCNALAERNLFLGRTIQHRKEEGVRK